MTRTRTLITGDAGCTGSHLADELLASDCRVRDVDRREPTDRAPGRTENPRAGRTASLAEAPERDDRARPADGDGKPVLLLGGAGFVGTNLAARLLTEGVRVTVLDDLSRPGAKQNLAWLSDAFGSALEVCVADVRDEPAVRAAVARASAVYHFAARVIVAASPADPRADFEVNSLGMLTVLEALRALPDPPPLVFTSTSKVYGRMADIPLAASGDRYEPVDATVRQLGVSEARSLDCSTPDGSSKGAADQFVLDWARTYGLPALVFRMSCIYGPHQRGTVDQGWLTYLLRNALAGRPVRLYGDGMQVRDLLFVADLVEALLAASDRASELTGAAFNVGGGPEHSMSLLELIDLVEELFGVVPKVEHHPWRSGHRLWYVSDTRAVGAALGWHPRVGVREGMERVALWLGHGGRARKCAPASIRTDALESGPVAPGENAA